MTHFVELLPRVLHHNRRRSLSVLGTWFHFRICVPRVCNGFDWNFNYFAVPRWTFALISCWFLESIK